MSIKRRLNTALTPEQLKFEKENRTMSLAAMANRFGITIGTLSYKKSLIKKQELPPVPKNFFDADAYFKELTTI